MANKRYAVIRAINFLEYKVIFVNLILLATFPITSILCDFIKSAETKMILQLIAIVFGSIGIVGQLMWILNKLTWR